jgi:hypothetical protein
MQGVAVPFEIARKIAARRQVHSVFFDRIRSSASAMLFSRLLKYLLVGITDAEDPTLEQLSTLVIYRPHLAPSWGWCSGRLPYLARRSRTLTEIRDLAASSENVVSLGFSDT